MTHFFSPKIALLGVIWLASCATAPPSPVLPDTTIDGEFQLGSNDAAFDASWWTNFNDPALSSLIEQSLLVNKSLDIAAANVRLTDAIASGQRLERSYSTGTTANAQIGRAARKDQNVAVSTQAGIGASWELDAFGRIAAQIAAAEFDVEAAIQVRRDVAVIIASQTALNYIELRGAQRRLDVARQNAQTQAQGLDLLQTLLDNGRATQLDLERANAQYLTTLASLPRYEATIQTSISALAALTAQPANAPSDTLKALAQTTSDIPELGGAILTGSVADLVRRRPDIRAAEATLGRQLALGDAARANLFPTVTLNADLLSLFSNTNDIGDLTSFGFGIGPSISWAGPDLRRVRANIAATDARAEAAIVQYEQTILTALSEVEIALTEYSKELERRQDLRGAVESARRANGLARLRFEEGLDDYLDVLDAQRTVLNAEDQLAQSRLQSSRQAIAAYRSLGGVRMKTDTP